MEFFGITLYGPQNYIGDLMNKEYHEPTRKEEVPPLMEKILSQSTCPEKVGIFSTKLFGKLKKSVIIIGLKYLGTHYTSVIILSRDTNFRIP